MAGDHVATSRVEVDAPPERVWAVITDPDAAREFMFGAETVTDWAVGGPIRWRGEWEGTPYEDHGEVLEFRTAAATRDDPLPVAERPGGPYDPTTTPSPGPSRGTGRRILTLSQDNNPTPEAAAHSEEM